MQKAQVNTVSGAIASTQKTNKKCICGKKIPYIFK